MRFLLLATAFCLCLPAPAAALTRQEGSSAVEICETFRSTSRHNPAIPDNFNTSPRQAYELLASSKVGCDRFQVLINGAPVATSRWVGTSKGIDVVETGSDISWPAVNASSIVTHRTGTESTDNLLTLSWQPAFCETRPDKQECRDLNGGLLPHTTRQLSIHGLWPQPQGTNYCGVPASLKALDNPDSWNILPAPEIDTETADALSVAMPGFASFLHHHEWIKHGTCYLGRGGADEYYDDTLYLTNLVNRSEVVELFANNIGKEITGADIRAAFDTAFGAGTGQRVGIKCTRDGNRNIINEIWISLKGTIMEESDLGELMLAAEATGMGCRRGIIDPAGLQ